MKLTPSIKMAPDGLPSGRLWRFLLAILFGVAYYEVARLGLAVLSVSGAPAVSPASGLALAGLYLWGFRLLPVVLVADGLAMAAELPQSVAGFSTAELMATLGRTIGAAIGAAVLRPMTRTGAIADGPTRMVAFIVAGAVPTALAASAGDILMLQLKGLVFGAQGSRMWMVAFISHVIGVLVVCPMVIAWNGRRRGALPLSHRIEAFAVLGGAALVGGLIFGQPLDDSLARYPLTLAFMPFLVWAAIRLDFFLLAVIVFLGSALAVTFTAMGRGPFAIGMSPALMPLQSFLGVMAATAFILHAVVRQWRATQDSLRHSEEALRQANLQLEDRVEQRTRELKRSEQKYRRIIETTKEGFALLDPEHFIQDVNEALFENLGYDRHEIIRRPIHSLIHRSEDNAPPLETAEPTQTEHTTFEAVFKSKDGREIPYLVNTSTFRDDEGRVVGYIAFLSDITEIKRAEALRQDVERVTRHDMKNALNMVIYGPQLIRREDNLTETQIECLSRIEESGYLILNMINLSLDLYKMETGTYQLNPEPVDLVPVVKKAIGDIAVRADAADIEVETLVDGAPLSPDDRFVVRGEKLLCYTMLSNILKNAVEASPEGETVTVRLDRLDGGQRVSVENRGVVPMEIRHRFFEKYATADKEGGTGLGAYSARLIARTHGGRIGFETSDQTGRTVVTVTLPAGDDVAVASRHEHESAH